MWGDRSATLEIRFKISPSNRVEFLQTAGSLMEPSREPPGLSCMTCFEQLGVVNSFLWRESWESVTDLEGRLDTTTIKTLLGAIGVLGELEAVEILTPSNRPAARTS